MSGVVKTVKKVFKKVVKVAKKIIKPVLVGAAIYFTAGLALSAFPATAGFAAQMPGFAGGGFLGTGIGAGVETAGQGIFSKAATAIGLGGKIQTAAANLQGVAETTAVVSGGGGFGVFGGGGGGAAGGGGLGATLGKTAAAQIPKDIVAKAGMSLTDKLLLAKLGTDLAGAAFGPTPQEEFEAQAIEQAKFRGGFYGMDAAGNTAPAPQQAAPQAQRATQAPPQQPQELFTPPQAPGPNVPARSMGRPPGGGDYSATVSPEQQALLAGREKRELFPRSGGRSNQPGVTSGPGAMQSNIELPEGLFSAAENVRYV